jgi:hypothetical protein
LLRRGLVYEGSARTLAREAWLHRQRFQSGPLALASEESYGTVVQAKGRRDALDNAIADRTTYGTRRLAAFAEGRLVIEVARQGGHSATGGAPDLHLTIKELEGAENSPAEDVIRGARSAAEPAAGVGRARQ